MKLKIGYYSNIQGTVRGGMMIKWLLMYADPEKKTWDYPADPKIAHSLEGVKRWHLKVKPKMIENGYPMANLPYLEIYENDENFQNNPPDNIIFQTDVILEFVAEKYNLLGQNDKEKYQIKQFLVELRDLMNKFAEVVIFQPNKSRIQLSAFETFIPEKLAIFEETLKNNKTTKNCEWYIICTSYTFLLA